MTVIPGKQLITIGTVAELRNNLLNREIGYCPDDHRCYIKYGDIISPFGGDIFVAEYNVTAYADIRGAIPQYDTILVQISANGTTYLLQMASFTSDSVLFSAVSSEGANVKYYAATVTPSGWSTMDVSSIYTLPMTNSEFAEILAQLQ